MAKKRRTKNPAKRATLLDIASDSVPVQRKTFFSRLSANDQAELLELRRAYKADKLKPHINARWLYENVFSPRFPGVCSDATFRRWINGRTS